MRNSPRVHIVGSALLLAGLLGASSSRAADCTISGPTQVCPGDSIMLCGPPQDGASFLWMFPDGFAYETDCVWVFEPGLYTLQVRDPVTRVWTDPCSLTVTPGRVNAPSITGPASACAGASVNWCGPLGNFEFAWTGPAGFTANTSCVSVSAAGNYSLRVRPLPNGCWGDPSSRTLQTELCQPTADNCPRPAWWWKRQGTNRDPHRRLSDSQFSQVAGCVDSRTSAFDWSNDVTGLLRTMNPDRSTLRLRARRQFAAVWANVCAGDLRIVPERGPSIGLDQTTQLDPSLGGGTVGSWLAHAEGELSRLEGASERKRAVKDSYRRLIRTAWHINHGRGIGATCRNNPHLVQGEVEDDMEVSSEQMEPLASELVDDGDGPLAFAAPMPNPFRNSEQMSLAFSVTGTASEDVTIAVFDVSGRMVRELARGMHAPGQYVATWDGRGSNGSLVNSGLYFVRGRVGGGEVQSRVMFVR